MDFSGCENVNYCPELRRWAGDSGLWEQAENGYEPQPGNMILFDWDGGRSGADHVGLVVSYDPASQTITTVEGNSSNSVRTKTYSMTDACVMGFIRNNV